MNTIAISFFVIMKLIIISLLIRIKQLSRYRRALQSQIRDIVKPYRIKVDINADLRKIENQEMVDEIYAKNIDAFQRDMNKLNEISIRKQGRGLLEEEWKGVFFSVLLNQNYEYGSVSYQIDFKNKFYESFGHIKMLHCGYYEVLPQILSKQQKIHSLQSRIRNHGLIFYGEGDTILIADGTYNIYGIISREGLLTQGINNLQDFVFLEDKQFNQNQYYYFTLYSGYAPQDNFIFHTYNTSEAWILNNKSTEESCNCYKYQPKYYKECMRKVKY